jgi:hypothetical protein
VFVFFAPFNKRMPPIGRPLLLAERKQGEGLDLSMAASLSRAVSFSLTTGPSMAGGPFYKQRSFAVLETFITPFL